MATIHGPSVKSRAKKFEAVASEETGKTNLDKDYDEEDSMDFSELVQAILQDNEELGKTTNTEVLREVFNILDCDGDGFITIVDLRQAMSSFSEDEDKEENEKDLDDTELQEMIDEADSDGDGKISFEDFLQVLVSSEEEKIKKKIKK